MGLLTLPNTGENPEAELEATWLAPALAGLGSQVTDWDTWMIRHLWNNLKSRFQ